MPASQITTLVDHVRKAIIRDDASTDGQFLLRYLEHRDEAAFAALLRRHGPMVWGVCCRLLPRADAEDAFQATFLVLIRKAGSITPREKVANWLYGVAHQTALHARRTAARRRARERQVTPMPEPAVAQSDQCQDLQHVLDQELSRLPEAQREIVVLSDLEGRTRREVARQLGLPEGTVASRLARARALLAKRLSKRGITLSGGALAASVGVPNTVMASTLQAARLLAAGHAVSGTVTALTEGVMKAMLLDKLKAVVVVVVLLGFLAIGTTVLSSRTTAGQGDSHLVTENPVHAAQKPRPEKAGVLHQQPITAWGKEVGGLQAGLGYRPGECRVYQPGETVKLVVRVRNVGKEEIRFQYLRHFFIENPPLVVNDKGEPITFKDGSPRGIYQPLDATVAPGKEIELYELNLIVGEKSIDQPKASTLFGEGKFQLQYKRVLGDSMLSSVSIQGDPVFRKLETGKLDVVVSRWIRRSTVKEEREAVTAWGKEVGGLQAGLGFRPGEHRVYHHGEMVTLVVRVRNIGKEAMKFEYLKQYFMENPPAMTDKGKPFGLESLHVSGERHKPVEVDLAPGKEVELYELKLDLRAPDEIGKGKFPSLYFALCGTGKVQVQYKWD